MASPSTPSPLVFIVGSTGTGKSKVGVCIAKWLQERTGKKVEILNVDAMQMYKGLPIATNQVNDGEDEGIPHHFLGFLDPLDDPITVGDFTEKAVNMIEKIENDGKIPILVGGSNYYMQSLLLSDSLVTEEHNPADTEKSKILAKIPDLNTIKDADLHALLTKTDVLMAEKYHPNDIRRIRRSLEICKIEGVLHSDIIKAQDKERLRFTPNTRNIVFCTDCDRNTLYDRLDNRVDKMVERGIVAEAESFWESLKNKIPGETLPTKGVFSAIGFKELHPYLTGKSDLASGLTTLKANTRRYAKQQQQWIKNRILPRDNIFVYRIDTTDSAKWREQTAKVAFTVLEGYLSEGKNPHPDALPYVFSGEKTSRTDVGVFKLFKCPVCPGKVLAGEEQFRIHKRSKRHKILDKKQKRAEKRKEPEQEGGERDTDLSKRQKLE
eukprot:TRINITY_DN35052_c0_g1_i1.p1 TRINITY_DN35052_c0_g1~~TRINITY_DN35052_c0_g1_i1.p1  ORF type:complete len:437 (+),score=100.37 TRINITY_DN35052_c0_g1_i1:53-1363(+)